jgi:hypothetical protein
MQWQEGRKRNIVVLTFDVRCQAPAFALPAIAVGVTLVLAVAVPLLLKVSIRS